MKHLFIILIFGSIFSLASTAHADGHASTEQAEQASSANRIVIKEGTHFSRLPESVKVSTGDKIEVRELFWYGCPHCNALEPVVINWLKTKPANSEFVAMPAVFSQRWVFHAKVFYTLQALGIEEQAHPLVFDSIHRLRKPVNTLKQVNEFLKRNNFEFDADTVENAFNSFTVDTNMRAANAYSLKSGANAVPAIIVDGKFLTSVAAAGGRVELFQVVDELIALAQTERGS